MVFSFLSVVVVVEANESDSKMQVRALLPNPQGSDTEEWILLENSSLESIEPNLYELQDTEGATQIYTIESRLEPGELFFLNATMSGIALNNAQDSLQLSLSGNLIQQTPPYTDAQDNQVWWQSDDGKWQWEELSAFLVRVTEKNFHVSQSGTESTTPAQTKVETTTPRRNTDTVTTPTPDIVMQLEEKPYAAVMPQLLSQSLPAIAAGERLSDISFPDFNFSDEKEQFVIWKRNALMGSLLLIWGGICFIVICFPYWWEWYRWRF